jgi:hypothetical protein
MNIPIIVFGFIVVFFVWRGYQKGLAVSLSRYFSCLIAYLASVIFTNPFSKIITQYFPLEGLIVYFIAAGLIFFVSGVIANYLVGKLINGLLKNNSDGEYVGNISKISGAFVGVLAGCFVGLLMVYIINFSQKITASATSDIGVVTQNAQSPEVIDDSSLNVIVPVSYEDQKLDESQKAELPVQESFIDSVSNKMVSKTLTAAVDLTSKNPTTKTLAQALSDNPEAAFGNLKKFINDKNVSRILADSEVQDLLKQGNPEALLKNQKFRALVENRNMKAVFAGAKEEAVAEAMVVVWRRADSIKNNPRVIEIVSDQEFISQINSANTLQLLVNPKLKELTEIIAGKE